VRPASNPPALVAEYASPLLRTTVVGSYPQPDWLVDREKLLSRLPPRVRARDVWRVAEPWLEQAQDDATLIAIRDMERAGIDVISDGEIRRESYSNRFATALEGVDLDNPGQRASRSGRPDIVPRIVGPIRRRHPVEVRDVQFLRSSTDRPIKITLPGPFTMTQQAVDDFYRNEARLAMDFAVAVNEEIQDLVSAGADIIQIDEPYLQARLEAARDYAVPAINRALRGVQTTTVLHTCFGYGLLVKNKPANVGYPFLEDLVQTSADQISIEAAQPGLDLSVLDRMGDKTMIVGVLDLGTPVVESQASVEDRIRLALRHIRPERLVLAPDCGMKYLPRQAAFDKLSVMVRAANTVRQELRVPTGGGTK
jgi:5-methyltetrahydropteroyltriglutamate--homocysteine methyltransferase